MCLINNVHVYTYLIVIQLMKIYEKIFPNFIMAFTSIPYKQ